MRDNEYGISVRYNSSKTYKATTGRVFKLLIERDLTFSAHPSEIGNPSAPQAIRVFISHNHISKAYSPSIDLPEFQEALDTLVKAKATPRGQ